MQTLGILPSTIYIVSVLNWLKYRSFGKDNRKEQKKGKQNETTKTDTTINISFDI